MSAKTASDPTTRRWRVLGFTEGKATAKPVRQSVVQGDRALDAAMRELEHDHTITRIRVEPAS